ncbi:Integral membrane protein OS=Streptomyces fumanus OX=67302 GN=GCM10018772_38650 PE=4 SV=1 [Streptomyces fumanus]
MSFTGVVLLWMPTAVVSAVIVLLLRRGRRGRGFLRPSTLVALCCVALLNAATCWFIGLSQAGLDLREACEYDHGVRFDDKWNDAHYAESQQFFPLHARCNADVDLVPAWINPTIIALVLLAAALLGAALFLAVRTFTEGRKKTHA